MKLNWLTHLFILSTSPIINFISPAAADVCSYCLDKCNANWLIASSICDNKNITAGNTAFCLQFQCEFDASCKSACNINYQCPMQIRSDCLNTPSPSPSASHSHSSSTSSASISSSTATPTSTLSSKITVTVTRFTTRTLYTCSSDASSSVYTTLHSASSPSRHNGPTPHPVIAIAGYPLLRF